MKRTTIVGLVALVAVSGEAARTLPHLETVRPGPELKAELARYGMKAYAITDGTNTMKALHYAPQVRTGQRYPMIVYVPGNGEIGDPIRQFRQRMFFNRLTATEFQRRHPCHLLALSPAKNVRTFHGGDPDRPTAVQQLAFDLVQAVCGRSRSGVDRERLYLTGYSYGGSAVTALAQHFPGSFAAVVPISGLPPLEEYFVTAQPGNWWYFYNEGDYARRELKLDSVKAYQKKTNAAGGEFRIGSYPEESHDAWTKAWREEAVWEWMFSKALKHKGATSGMQAQAISLAGSICTASVPGTGGHSGPERVIDGLEETAYRPALSFTEHDWWKVRFPHPVSGSVEVISGERDGSKKLTRGTVEVSSDGQAWTRAGVFSSATGRCAFTRTARFSYLRVRVKGNATPRFVLRSLTLRARP